MAQLPVDDRANVIIITLDGKILSNHMTNLYGWEIKRTKVNDVGDQLSPNVGIGTLGFDAEIAPDGGDESGSSGGSTNGGNSTAGGSTTGGNSTGGTSTGGGTTTSGGNTGGTSTSGGNTTGGDNTGGNTNGGNGSSGGTTGTGTTGGTTGSSTNGGSSGGITGGTTGGTGGSGVNPPPYDINPYIDPPATQPPPPPFNGDPEDVAPCPQCNMESLVETASYLKEPSTTESGPFLRYRTPFKTIDAPTGLDCIIDLPYRTIPCKDGTPNQRSYNAMHDKAHILAGEEANCDIYFGARAKNSAGVIGGEHDIGVQYSGVKETFGVIVTFTLNSGFTAFDQTAPSVTLTNFSQFVFKPGSALQVTATSLNNEIAYRFKGTRISADGNPAPIIQYVPFTIIVKDNGRPEDRSVKVGFNKLGRNVQFKSSTSIAQTKNRKPADQPIADNWFCGVRWERMDNLYPGGSRTLAMTSETEMQTHPSISSPGKFPIPSPGKHIINKTPKTGNVPVCPFWVSIDVRKAKP